MRYYSLSSLDYLFKKFNLKIFYVKKIPTHGDLLEFMLQIIKVKKDIHQFQKF